MPADKSDLPQGTLDLLILTIVAGEAQHGYAIAQRLRQMSRDVIQVRQGTLYPALLKLEQEGYIASDWGISENNRKAKFYRLTRAGRKQLEKEARDWQQTTAIVERFLSPKAES